jgi:hypothetical protein
MPKLNPMLSSLALCCGCTAALAGGPARGDGFVRDNAVAASSPVSLSLPSCANKDTVVKVGVTYPAANPTQVTVTLTQPTSGPPYLLEQKTNKRNYDGASGGTNHYFYIDPFIQIGGTAKVKVVVAGVGKASGSFVIPCP